MEDSLWEVMRISVLAVILSAAAVLEEGNPITRVT
jgi:hypothetical protein